MTQEIHEVHFRVPNTKEGRKFIDNLRRWKNKERIGKIDALTRGPRPSGPSTQADRKTCKGFAIYLRESKGLREEKYKRENARWEEHEKTERAFHRVVKEHHEYKDEAEKLQAEMYEENQKILEKIEGLGDLLELARGSQRYWRLAASALAVASFAQSVYLVLR